MSAEATPARSLLGRIGRAWTAPGRSWAEEWRASPGEARLIAFAFGTAFFLTLRRLMTGPEAVTENALAWMTATVFIGFSFGMLALYGVAALARLCARVCGGEGGWAETRLALFWSGLAAGPAGVVLAGLFIAAGAPQLGGWLAGLVWATLFAPMLAAAHGFAAWRVGAVFGALLLAALALNGI